MNKSDLKRNLFMLHGALAKRGYDWWWHSFTGYHYKTNQPKTFYIEYFFINPAVNKNEVSIIWDNREAQEKKKKPSYVMINVGTWGENKKQLHNFYPWKDVIFKSKKIPDIEVGNCKLTEKNIKGSVYVEEKLNKLNPQWMSDAGSMSWDLKVEKKISYNVGYGACRFFRLINAFEMFWHAEGMKTLYSGEVVLDGERYIVRPDDCYGYADKNWGGDFTSPWVWLSSNNLISNLTNKRLENSVFEIGGGRPKIFKIPLNRKLLGEFYYEGKDYEFNFSKFWTFCRTKFNCYETDNSIVWQVRQTTIKHKIEINVTCDKKDMLLINYESPDGYKRHNRLWNCGCGTGNIKLYSKKRGKYILIDDVKALNIGCEYGEY